MPSFRSRLRNPVVAAYAVSAVWAGRGVAVAESGRAQFRLGRGCGVL